MSAARFAVELLDEPWLEPFIEDDDDDIDAVRRRFEDSQLVAMVQLRRDGVDWQHHRRHVTPRGYMTTALDLKSEVE